MCLVVLMTTTAFARPDARQYNTIIFPNSRPSSNPIVKFLLGCGYLRPEKSDYYMEADVRDGLRELSAALNIKIGSKLESKKLVAIMRRGRCLGQREGPYYW